MVASTIITTGTAHASTDVYLADRTAVNGANTGTENVNGHLYLKSVYQDYPYYASAGSTKLTEYDLGRQCSKFTVTLGLNDSSASNAQVKFEVIKDGTDVASPTLSLGTSQVVTFDATNVLRLGFRSTVLNQSSASGTYTAVFADPVATCLGVPARTSFDQKSTTITFGDTTHITGVLTDIGGDPVAQTKVHLEYTTGNGYGDSSVADTTTDAQGRYGFDVSPDETVTYQTAFIPANDYRYTLGGGTTLVQVKPKLFFTTARKAGTKSVRLDGKLFPYSASPTVAIRIGSITGKIVARVPISYNGAWHVKVKFAKTGTYKVYATVPVGATFTSNSAGKSVKATK